MSFVELAVVKGNSRSDLHSTIWWQWWPQKKGSALVEACRQMHTNQVLICDADGGCMMATAMAVDKETLEVLGRAISSNHL